MNLTIQAGENLYLILFQSHHASALFHLIEKNRSLLEPWLPWIRRIRDINGIKGYIQRSLTSFSQGHEAHFGIWNQGVLIGSITVERMDHFNKVAELGYWLSRDQTGRGLVTRSVQGIASYLFQEHRMHRLEIRTEATNHSSRHVAIRAGFREEGILREALQTARGTDDLIIYGLLSSEFAEPANP